MAQTKIKQRQIEGGLDGWIPTEETWTYASASTITVPSGAGSLYQKGDWIKITQTTAKYFKILAVTDTLVGVTPNITVASGDRWGGQITVPMA